MIGRRWYGLLLVAALCGIEAAQSAAPEAPKGFEPLFNGKDLTGWHVNKGGKMSVWGAQNGILYVDGRGGGWLMTEKEYGDFELRLEFKVPPRGNSGVALRSPMEGDPAYAGMEIQILDDQWHKNDKNYKGLRPTQLTGAIYDVVPPGKDATKPAGEWNQFDITAKGRHVTIVLNGTTIVDANLDDYKNRADRHPGLLREKGHLGLQSHDGRVEFRNLYVKPL
ncbi:MAG TPA: DUF1080 domain-containing protein [Gemmataceae bacterium]|nr:DUF1080 domain-containing protein [Gemmataceae bacterium]